MWPVGLLGLAATGLSQLRPLPVVSGHLMQRTDSLEKTLMLGGIGGPLESRRGSLGAP